MASRKPLVVIQGQIAQLNYPDTLDGYQEVDLYTTENEQGSTITTGQPVYASSSGKVSLAKADDPTTKEFAGLVKANIADGATGIVQTGGVVVGTTTEWDAVTGQTGGLTPNSDYYLSTDDAGKLTKVAPTGSGLYIVKMGRATSATQMLILDQHDVKIAGLPGTALLRTTGATTFDPNIVRTGGVPPTWYFGDGTSAVGDSVSHDYASAGDYEVRWTLPPENLRDTAFGSDLITEITTSIHWTNLEAFNVSTNLLDEGPTTYAEWTSLDALMLNGNDFATLETHSEWTGMKSVSMSDNSSLTGLTMHSGWTLMESIHISNNTSMSTLVIYSWTPFWFFWADNCNFSAATIDAWLIALDASGKTNGNMKYQTNPGSSDGSRSTAAATAKSNLVTKGWTIVN